MLGFCQNKKCKKLNKKEAVHRAAWSRYTPHCKECGKALRPNKLATKQVRSRRAAIG